MSSEFQQLSEKVAQLAALTYALRQENADLRLQLTTLSNDNMELSSRIDTAYARVSTLLENLPAATPISDEEVQA